MSASPPHDNNPQQEQPQQEQQQQGQQQQGQQQQDQEQDQSLPSYAANPLLGAFAAFLTVAIHSLLFHRALYPPTSFLVARAYNLPVHQSRHPLVCAWIDDAVSAIASQLFTGSVRRIAFVVHGAPPQLRVRERWVFDVERFPAWGDEEDEKRLDREVLNDDYEIAPTSHQLQEEEDDELLMEGGQPLFEEREEGEEAEEGEEQEEEGEEQEKEEEWEEEEEEEEEEEIEEEELVQWADIHEELRGALQRLAYAAQAAEKLPPGCTFTLALELRDETEAPIGDPQPWIPSDRRLQPPTMKKPVQGRSLKGAITRPIRAVRADPLFFECWLEQGPRDPPVVKQAPKENKGDVPNDKESKSIKKK